MLLLNTQNANFFYLAEKDLGGHIYIYIYRIMCEEYVAEWDLAHYTSAVGMVAIHKRSHRTLLP
jgi:hypothetical protein